MQSKTSLIVFDIDGTLTESVEIHQNAFVKSLQHIGVNQFNKQFGTYTHHTDLHIAKVIYETATNKKFNEETATLFENSLLQQMAAVEVKEIQGAKNFIEYIENHTAFGTCFATGSMYLPAKYKLDQAGIKFNPELLVASNQLEEREKIVEKAIAQALKHYKVAKFNRIISFGDGLWDLRTAQNLSLEFIGIGTKNSEVLYQNGMQKHYPDFSTLLNNPL